MDYSSFLEILAILLGNGVIVTVIGFAIQHQEHKSEKDFEA